MRLAVLVGSFPELSEKFILNQLCGLIDRGIAPEVFAAMRAPGGPGAKGHELAGRYGLAARATYADLPRSAGRRLLEAPGLLASCLARDPASALRALRISDYATAAKNLKTLYFLEAFAGRRYDILHCHFGPSGLVGAFLKDCGLARRLVVTFHGSDINGYPRRHGEGVYRVLYDRADAVTCGSRFIRDRLVANGCPPGKIRVIPVGVRLDEYPEPSEPREEGLVLSVGRLAEAKGFRYAIEALAALKPRFPKARYAIAGGGSGRAELEELARRLGVADSVSFLGDQSDLEVAALYRRASVFVLPSVRGSNGAEEGQGLVLQEAQASGLPVVSTRIGGIPEGLVEGETGLLAPERDGAALAGRIAELLGDASLRERMGRAGRAFVAERYDVAKLSGALVGLYGEIL
ncbi:MAG TPA: glycosyltransferase [Spirochaetales bacterium]|nr:glycosyltransferase [Spirochaetales bacterium]HRY53117.1 glycosyltransferase [Spirochaetia bacterium]HRZ64666.1 glycosyltransferase [Spirochaetia bacterium]